MADDVASRLVGELEATGTPAESGEFTIDEAAALRKLGQYRLANPHDWLCLVVEAASLLEASKVTIDSKRGELIVEFDSVAVGLDGLFGSVFAAGLDPSPIERARRKLAIASQTLATSEEFEQLTITDASGRLVVERERVRFEAGATQAELRGTRLNVERRGRGWPELDRVRERCAFASLAILVDGEPVAFGLNHALDSVQAGNDRWPILDQDQTIGMHGWRGGYPFPSEVLLICDGVLTERIPVAGNGDLAIVEGSFRKDLGEVKVLRNEYFDHVMAVVESHRANHVRLPVSADVAAIADPSRPLARNHKAGLVAATSILAAIFIPFILVQTDRRRPQPPAKMDALRTAEIADGLAPTIPDIQACGSQYGREPETLLKFDMWIGNEGRIRAIELLDIGDSELGTCVETALREAKFRSFDAAIVEGSTRADLERRRRDSVFANVGGDGDRMAKADAAHRKELDDLERLPGTQYVQWTLEF